MLSSDGLSSYSILCCKGWNLNPEQGAEWMLNMTRSELEELIQLGNQGEINALLYWKPWKDGKPWLYGRSLVELILFLSLTQTLLKMSKQTWRCFSSRGGDPGNFIPVFLRHRIAFSSASSWVFLIWVGDALIVPRGHFGQSEMSTSMRARAVVTHIQLEHGLCDCRCVLPICASFCFLAFLLNSELAVMILISMLAPNAVFSSLSLRYKTAPFIDQQAELGAWRQAEASSTFITHTAVQLQASWKLKYWPLFSFKTF